MMDDDDDGIGKAGQKNLGVDGKQNIPTKNNISCLRNLRNVALCDRVVKMIILNTYFMIINPIRLFHHYNQSTSLWNHSTNSNTTLKPFTYKPLWKKILSYYPLLTCPLANNTRPPLPIINCHIPSLNYIQISKRYFSSLKRRTTSKSKMQAPSQQCYGASSTTNWSRHRLPCNSTSCLFLKCPPQQWLRS